MHLTPYRHYYTDATPPPRAEAPTSNKAIDALLDKAIRKASEGDDREEDQRGKAEVRLEWYPRAGGLFRVSCSDCSVKGTIRTSKNTAGMW